MVEVNAIGMAIYTYSNLENQVDLLWDWVMNVEKVFGNTFEECVFAPRNKISKRVNKLTLSRRNKLVEQLKEQPWQYLAFGWPLGGFVGYPPKLTGVHVSIHSKMQFPERYRRFTTPSYISLIINPSIIANDIRLKSFLELGKLAWQQIGGIYGFIDVDTGIAPNNNLMRTMSGGTDNLLPRSFWLEFQQWYKAQTNLDQLIWKAFWGNFLNANHISSLVFKQDSIPTHSDDTKTQNRVYKKFIEILHSVDCIEEIFELSDGGALLTLSASPMDWHSDAVQRRLGNLQDVVGGISVSSSHSA